MVYYFIRIHTCEDTGKQVIQTLDNEHPMNLELSDDEWFCWHNENREDDALDVQTLLANTPRQWLTSPEFKNRALTAFIHQNRGIEIQQ